MKLTYKFEDADSCNMCGSTRSRILGQRLSRAQGLRPKKLTGISVSVVKCDDCGLIYANPKPIPENIEDHYGTPPDSYWKSGYFEDRSNYFQGEISMAKKLLDFETGMKALDIGAGIGKCMKALDAAGFEAYGIEPSASFRTAAIDKMGIDSERLMHSTLESANFEPGMFDFITFGAVLEHLYDPSECITRVLRWLKPNGIIHIEVPSSKYLMAKLVNLYYRAIGSSYVTNISPMHKPFHLYEFGLDSFKLHARRNGYEVAAHEYFVCPIFHFPRFTHPMFRWWMKSTDSGMQLTVWLRKTGRAQSGSSEDTDE